MIQQVALFSAVQCAYESSLGCNPFHKGPQAGRLGESLATTGFEKTFRRGDRNSHELYSSYISYTAYYMLGITLGNKAL